MTVAGAPNNGQTYFLFGPKKSCYYNITAAGTASQNPVTTTSECNPLPALDIREPRTVNYGGAIWIFGKVKAMPKRTHSTLAIRLSLPCHSSFISCNQSFHNPDPSQ